MDKVNTKMAHACAAVLAMGLVGCAAQKPAAPEPDPQVKVERLFPKPSSMDSSTLAVKVAVYNPRSKAISLTSMSYSVDTGDVAGVLEGEVEVGATIDPEQVIEAEFDVEIPFPVADQAAYEAVLSAGTVSLMVKGSANFAEVDAVAFERKGAVATPSLPKLVIHDAQAARYGEEGLDVTFFLRLINENAFTVTVGQVDYAVSVYEKELKAQTAGIGVTLVAGAAQEFEVSVVLEEKTFAGVTKKLKSGLVTYEVAGSVSVDEKEYPFSHPGEIKLDME